MIQGVDAQVRAIDSAIAECDPLPENILGWRLFDSQLIHIHGRRLIGTVLSDLGFVDLTFLKDVACRYVRGAYPALAEVRLPAGAKVLPMFQTLGSSEGDLLLARGSHFVVRDVGAEGQDRIVPVTLELLA